MVRRGPDEPVAMGTSLQERNLSLGNLNIYNGRKHAALQTGEDTISIFQGCALYKHPQKDIPKGHQSPSSQDVQTQ